MERARWTYPAFVARVDEGDEPPGQVSRPQVHARHVRDDERLVAPRQLDVVGRARGSADDLVERERCGFAARSRHADRPPPDHLRGWVRRIVLEVAQEPEPLLRMRLRGFVERVVVDAGGRARDLSVVCCRVETDHPQAPLQQVDARDE